MKVSQIIQRFDDERKNTVSADRKLRWLEEVERIVIDETILTHELPESLKDTDFSTYFDSWDMDSDLLVPPPWDDVYIHWMDRKLAWAQREPKFMNVATTLYDNAMLSYNGWYNRNNKPLHKAFPWLRHETL